MAEPFDPSLPSIGFLRQEARRRMPGFAFDYLEGGCNSNVNVQRNTDDIRKIKLKPYYVRDYAGSNLETATPRPLLLSSRTKTSLNTL